MLGCFRRGIIAISVLGAMMAPLAAQPPFEALPPIYPVTTAPTKTELDERESLKKYVLGLICLKEDRLLEGLKALEEAAKLNPKAAGVYRELVGVYLTLERMHDALASIEKVVTLDPDDSESWFLAARLYKTVGQTREYRRAVEKGLADPNLPEEHPEVAQQMFLDLAQLRETDEDLPGAIQALTRAAKILDHPDLLLDHGPFQREDILTRSAETYERIGNLHRKQKQFAEAIAAYQTAQKRAPEGAGRLSFNLAQVARQQGNLDLALKEVDQFLKTVPLGIEAHQFKIELLTELKREKVILPWLEQSAKVDVYNIPLRHLYAKTCIAQGQTQTAEGVFNKLAADAPSEEVYSGLFKILRSRPDGVATIFNLINRTVELAKKKPHEAGTVLAGEQGQAMVNVLRDEAALTKELVQHAFQIAKTNSKISYDTLRLFAVLADKHRRFEESERFYQNLLQDPGQRTEPAIYGGYLRALWRNHKFTEIVKVCDECLKNDKLLTNRLLFTSDKARALAALDRMPEALKMADETIKTAGDDNLMFAYELRIRLLTQSDKYADAEKECKELFKKFPSLENEQEIRYLLSGVYNAAHRKKESEEQLLEILKLDPNSASANNDLGYLWADQNHHLKEAEEMIRKAIEQDRSQRKLLSAERGEDNAAYIDSLGWVLFRKGEVEAARKELEKAVSLPDGDDPVLWDHLGDVYMHLKMPVQAGKAWEKSLQIFEQDRRRKMDDRYQEIQNKVKLVKNGGAPAPMGN